MVQKKLPLINSAHGSETRNIINEIIKAINDRGLEILSESAFLNWLDENGVNHQGEWDDTKEYVRLSVVLHEGNSYTSVKHVPVGVDILNEEFWVITGNYNVQVENITTHLEQLPTVYSGSISDNTSYKFERGTTTITEPIVINGENIHINGYGTKLLSDTYTFLIQNAKNVVIEGFIVEGGSQFIRVEGSVETLTIKNCKSIGKSLLFTNTTSQNSKIFIDKCEVDGLNKFINLVHINIANYVSIRDSVFKNTEADGIKFPRQFSEYILIDGCHFDNCLDQSIDFYGGGKNARVTNCTFLNEGAITLKRYGDDENTMNVQIDNFVIAYNTFIGIDRPLILYGGARNYLIQGNNFKSSDDMGSASTSFIVISGAINNCKVIDNTIVNNSRAYVFTILPQTTLEESGYFESTVEIINNTIIDNTPYLTFFISPSIDKNFFLRIDSNTLIGSNAPCLRNYASSKGVVKFSNNFIKNYETIIRTFDSAEYPSTDLVKFFLTNNVTENITRGVYDPANLVVIDDNNSWNIVD